MGVWNPKANALFLQALELPAPQRPTFLDEACAGDPGLRAEVEELLKAHDVAGNFLQRPLVAGLAEPLRRVAPAALAAPGSSENLEKFHPDSQEAEEPVSGVLGDFQIIREIGRGGMGVVYEVIDRKRGVELALKVLREPTAAAVLRLKREFRSLADLGHRNLVVLDRLFCVDRRWFFTMELIRGKSFTEYVRDPVGPDEATERVPPETVPSIGASQPRKPAVCPGEVHCPRLRHALEQVSLGLGALHQAGMLHRDVKPSNVLVSDEGRVVLVDFGLVAELKDAYSSGVGAATWGGTQPYMSPEQMAAQALTYASDWYSVGVMLYESLTGRLPFEGRAADVLSQKQEGPPQGLLDRVPPQEQDLAALCVDLLHPDPGNRPTGPEVLRRIRHRGGEDRAARAEDVEEDLTVFVGRTRQLLELRRALDDVRAGSCLRVYVSGKPGMGKTALVERFLSAVGPTAEAIVLEGRCYEREAMPYKALDSLVDAIIRHLNALPGDETNDLLPEDLCSLVRVFPALLHAPCLAAAASRGITPVDDREARTRAIASLRGLLERLADRAVAILVVDDLQWGDLDSAAFLSELLAPPGPPRVLFLACYRSDDCRRSECLQALLPEGEGDDRSVRQREIVVDELTPEEAQQLTVALLGSEGRQAEGLVALSQQVAGSPYLIWEFAHRAKREGRRMPEARGGSADLLSMLSRRIEQLPSAARLLLATIAVSGRPIRLDLACQVAGLGLQPEVAVALLRSENLIRSLADPARQVAVYHDCIREAAAAGLTSQERRRLHLQVATALEDSADADPAEMCRHFENAGDYDKAGRYALVAAERAARSLAFDQAAAMYRAALEWCKPTGQDEWSVRQKLADALSHAGRSAEAAEEYAALASCQDPTVRTQMQHSAAMHYLISGHIDTGRTWLDRVLKDAGIPVPRGRWQTILSLLINRARVKLRGLELSPPRAHRTSLDQARLGAYWCAVVGLSMIDPFRAAYYGARNVLLALEHGDAGLAARALAMKAFHSALAGPKAGKRTADLLDRAAALSGQAGDPYTRAILPLARSAAAFLEGEWAAALAHGRDSERLFRENCRSVFWELRTALMFQLCSLCYLGRFNELTQGVRECLDDARERGDLYTQLFLGTFPQPYLRILTDQPERAACEIDALMARWSSCGLYVEHISTLFAKANIAMYLGSAEAALETMAEARVALGRSLQWWMQHWRVLFKEIQARALIIAARTARDQRPLLKAAAKLGRSLQSENHPYAAAYGPVVQAPLAFAEGRRSEAVALLRSALAGFENNGLAFYAAIARRRLGELVAGQAGSEMVAQADAWMASENVVNIRRTTDLFCPWIEERH